MANKNPKPSPLSQKNWHTNKAANEGDAGDNHFRQLSERFWSFARSTGFAGGEKTLIDVMQDIWKARTSIAIGAAIGLGRSNAYLDHRCSANPYTNADRPSQPFE